MVCVLRVSALLLLVGDGFGLGLVSCDVWWFLILRVWIA